MSRFWAVLGRRDRQVFAQADVPVTDKKHRGRYGPAFPLYIECATSEDAQAILQLQDGVLEVIQKYHWQRREEMADAVEAIPGFSDTLKDVTPWWVILNGIHFKGLLLSENDFKVQKDHLYASYRKAYTFQEAVLTIILGEKPSVVISDRMERLSLQSPLTTSPLFRGVPRPPGLLASPVTPTRAKVRPKVEEPYTSTSLTGTGLNTQSSTLAPTIRRNTASCSGLVTSPQAPTVYKYIRNKAGVVGTITNPAGISSNITEDVIATLGESRAGYLDAHGFGPEEIMCIVDAFSRATSIDKFTALAAGSGMALTELEWFWGLSSAEG